MFELLNSLLATSEFRLPGGLFAGGVFVLLACFAWYKLYRSGNRVPNSGGTDTK